MIIKGHNVSNGLSRVVKSISNNLKNADKFRGEKLDEGSNILELKRPISASDAKYIYDNATFVATCSQILAEDTIMNDITLVPEDSEDERLKAVVDKINKNLNEQIRELENLAIDFNYSGFAAVEVDYSDGSTFTLKQLPSNTLAVVQVKINRENYYLLRQRINMDTVYYKIIGEDYPDDFNIFKNQPLTEVMLLGGDNFYLFYSEPRYMSIRNKIFTEIAIQTKTYNKVSKGNIASGILHFNLDPQFGADKEYDKDGNEIVTQSREEIISEELTDSDTGIAVLFTESERPLKMDFIDIEAKNDTYIENQQTKCENAVLNCFRVPIQRLMLQTPEAMNSHQSETIFEIYSITLKQEQKKYQEFIKELIYYLYHINVTVEMGIPTFMDNREKEVQLLRDSWNDGGLTLKQFIEGLSKQLDVVNLEDYDFTINQDLWDYRKVDGLYDSLDVGSQEELDNIESVLNGFNE